MTPTQRSLKKLRSEGYLVAIVEKWNPYVKIRQDLFGMFDLLAIKGDETIGVQTTSGSNGSARVQKLGANPMIKLWLFGHRKAVVHAWRKVGPRGKRKLWDCKETFL